MPIVITCPHCQQRMRLGDDAPGKRLRCPICKNSFTAAPQTPTGAEANRLVGSESAPERGQASNKGYRQPVSRGRPAYFIFLLDQSDSMNDGIAGSKRPKAEALASTINRFISDLIAECLAGDSLPRHFFDVSVIGYRTDGAGRDVVGPALEGQLKGRDVVSVVDLFERPLKEEAKEVDDGEGGTIIRRSHKWYEKLAEGGAPMVAGLNYCSRLAATWIRSHQESFPPIVIHVTGGESTDGDPEEAAEALRSLATNDGNVLLFHCHFSDRAVPGVAFPYGEHELPDERSRELFRTSSPLPPTCLRLLTSKGFDANASSRGMIVNADVTALLHVVHVGT